MSHSRIEALVLGLAACLASGQVSTPTTLGQTGPQGNEPRNRDVWNLALYPVASFAVAGPIRQGDGNFVGGTRTTTGGILAVTYGLLLSETDEAEDAVVASLRPKRPSSGGFRAVEFGAWYWGNYDGDADLYQVQLGYSFSREMALQLAYLNSTKAEAESATLFFVYRVFGTGERAPTVSLGAGLAAFFDPDVDNEGRQTDRTTVNTTLFAQLSLPAGRRTSFVGSLWSLRARNTDSLRMMLGLSYQL